MNIVTIDPLHAEPREGRGRRRGRDTARLAMLLEAKRAMASTLDLQQVLERIVLLGAKATEAESGTIWLHAEEDDVLVPKAAFGPKAEALRDIRLGAGEGLAGRSMTRREAILVQDVTTERGWLPRVDEDIGYRTRSLLCVPLCYQEHCRGALQFVNKRGGSRFDERDLDLAVALAGDAAVALENSLLFDSVRQLQESAMLAMVAAVDARDPYTHGHSERGSQLAVLTAREMGLPPDRCRQVAWAALLHDVGKIGVPDRLLRKRGPLTPREHQVMRRHPAIGAEIVGQMRPTALLRDVALAVRHHHERYDGSGYPDGLAGENIPVLARIIAVVDAFDAMTTNRPYRRAMTSAHARRELTRGAGSQFDPRVTAAFGRVLRSTRSGRGHEGVSGSTASG